MAIKIAVDCGHGIDTYDKVNQRGAKGIYDFAEYDFNNAVGKKMKPLLEKHGFEVLVTQPFDSKDIGISNRYKKAITEKCDLFWSIHGNYNAKTSANGRMNLYWKNTDNPFYAKSKKIAELFEVEAKQYMENGFHSFVECTDIPSNNWTNIGVLRETRKYMPAVLIEYAFFSNTKERELMKNDKFIQQCAEASVSTICKYFNIKYQGGENMDNKQPVQTNNQVSSWAQESWKWAQERKLLDGTRPKDNVTREELACVMHRLYQQLKG